MASSQVQNFRFDIGADSNMPHLTQFVLDGPKKQPPKSVHSNRRRSPIFKWTIRVAGQFMSNRKTIFSIRTLLLATFAIATIFKLLSADPTPTNINTTLFWILGCFMAVAAFLASFEIDNRQSKTSIDLFMSTLILGLALAITMFAAISQT